MEVGDTLLRFCVNKTYDHNEAGEDHEMDGRESMKAIESVHV